MNSTALAEKTVEHLPVAAPAGASPIMALLSDAIQKGANIDVIREIKALATELADDEARRAFDRAVSDAKANIPPISKNKRVGFASKKAGASRTDYAYEDFAEVARTVGPHLAPVGLSYRFRATQEGTQVKVTCILSHRDGHSEETTLVAAADSSGNKNSIQAVGSTVTYLQRYTLKMALGLSASEDDDGGGAEPDDVITDEQVEELRRQIDEVEGDAAALCEHFEIDALPAMLASDYETALQIIDNRRRKVGPR